MSKLYTTMHRNLNKAKNQPRVFVWSQSKRAMGRDGNPLLSMPKAPTEAHNAMLLNPVGVCNQTTLNAVERKAKRNVGAWVQGELATEAQEDAIFNGDFEWSLITMNPLPTIRNGRCEKEYHYCRVEDGELIIEEPVVWSDVLAADFTPNGASVYLKK